VDVSDPVLPTGTRPLGVADAQALILQQVRPLPADTMPLTSAAVGLVLAEHVASDLDMPPHDKAMMDGYAVRSADVSQGHAILTVVEEITAGQTPRHRLECGEVSRIMTGAPVPPGADAVVMVEHTRLLDAGRVQIEDQPPQPGQNILPRGREMRAGQVVLNPGAVLRAQEFGLLAAVGRTVVRLVPAPQVAILATGDELVAASQTPGPGQIRNSNGPMLLAQVWQAGGAPRPLGIGRDNMDSLRSLIAEGLQAHVLILSGGVSAGKLDLVPGVLREAGVTAHFHKVQMKPGKPLFFGTQEHSDSSRPRTLVFGLPGNPVSSLVCFELFARPALRRLRGLAEAGPHFVSAALTEDFTYHTDRPTYHPAHLRSSDSGWRVQPVAWFGSADLRGLTAANALVLLPAGNHEHKAGQTFPAMSLET
jgi:molybdopterin molybdotransferase